MQVEGFGLAGAAAFLQVERDLIQESSGRFGFYCVLLSPMHHLQPMGQQAIAQRPVSKFNRWERLIHGLNHLPSQLLLKGPLQTVSDHLLYKSMQAKGVLINISGN